MKKASIGFSQKNARLQGYLIMISQYLKCSYVEGEAFTSQESMLQCKKYQAHIALREIHKGNKKTLSWERFNV